MKFSGIVPLRLLYETQGKPMFSIAPSSDGIVPLSRLECSVGNPSSAKVANCDGMEPESEVLCRKMPSFRLVREAS